MDIAELNAEKQRLLNQISEIDKKIFDIQDAEKKQIESQYNISRDDRDKKCRGICDKCIIPCSDCYKGICEQCSYGYKNIVERLRTRYSVNELEELSSKCPYAILATMK